jgi:hypothetical protein
LHNFLCYSFSPFPFTQKGSHRDPADGCPDLLDTRELAVVVVMMVMVVVMMVVLRICHRRCGKAHHQEQGDQ